MALRVTLTDRVMLMAGDRLVDERDLAGRLGRMVITRLALSPRALGRYDLYDDLWPDGAPDAAESVLNATFSRLRRALQTLGIDAKAVLVSSKGVVQLRLPPGSRVDVATATSEIDRAEAALRRGRHRDAWSSAVVAHSISRRSLLPGLERHWIDVERDRLHHVFERALGVLIDVWLALDDPHQAVVLGRELVRSAPFSEASHRRLVTALIESGDRAAAATAIAHWEHVLQHDLGLERDDRLRELLTRA